MHGFVFEGNIDDFVSEFDNYFKGELLSAKVRRTIAEIARKIDGIAVEDLVDELHKY